MTLQIIHYRELLETTITYRITLNTLPAEAWKSTITLQLPLWLGIKELPKRINHLK